MGKDVPVKTVEDTLIPGKLPTVICGKIGQLTAPFQLDDTSDCSEDTEVGSKSSS
jgi:hypothetical protein